MSLLGAAWSQLKDQELHSAAAVFGGSLPLPSRGGKARMAVPAQNPSWIPTS